MSLPLRLRGQPPAPMKLEECLTANHWAKPHAGPLAQPCGGHLQSPEAMEHANYRQYSSLASNDDKAQLLQQPRNGQLVQVWGKAPSMSKQTIVRHSIRDKVSPQKKRQRRQTSVLGTNWNTQPTKIGGNMKKAKCAFQQDKQRRERKDQTLASAVEASSQTAQDALFESAEPLVRYMGNAWFCDRVNKLRGSQRREFEDY